MKVPLYRFSCGCVGISLDRPGRVEETTDVWLFSACDAEDGTIPGSVRGLSNHKVVNATPISGEEFEQLRMKTQQQLQAGEAMFDLHRCLNRGLACLDRFSQRVLPFPHAGAPHE